MVKPLPTYAQVVHERDEAIAERDFILEFVQDLGDALVQADAVSVAIQLRDLTRMASLARKPRAVAA